MAKRSKRFRLNWRDIGKGVLMAVIGSVVGGVQQLLFDGHSINQLDLNQIGTWAIAGGSSYIIKNVLEDSKGEVGLKKEQPEPDTDFPNIYQ